MTGREREIERLRFVAIRDGHDAALAFARQTFMLYKQTLRLGFRLPGTPPIANRRRGGRRLIMRRDLVESCITFRLVLRRGFIG